MSVQKRAKVFYGFLVDPEDCEFPDHELWEKLQEAGASRWGVRSVTHGPYDSYSQALAVDGSVVVVEANDIRTARLVPTAGEETLDRWTLALEKAAEAAHVKFKEPRWYFAVEVS